MAKQIRKPSDFCSTRKGQDKKDPWKTKQPCMQNLGVLESIATIIQVISDKAYLQEPPDSYFHPNFTLYFRPNMVFMDKLSLPTIEWNTLKQGR